MSEQEEKLQDDFDQDLKNVVDIYRTAKRLGLWAVGIFGFCLVVLSIVALLIQLTKKT